jgi:hypothetical protein
MPSIDDNFRLVKFIIKKNLNGDVSDDSFNRLINQAQLSYLSHLIGGTETYQQGRPISRVELGNNQHISQKLSPFIDTPELLTIDSNGNAVFPTDMIAVNAMFKVNATSASSRDYSGRIKWVNQDRLYSYLDDPIDPIAQNPIYLIEKNKFQFYPLSLGNAKISYIKKPVSAVWGYTTDANGRHVYNSATSQNLAWGEIDQVEILARVIRIIGVNLNAASVVNFANEIKAAGA